MPGPSDDGCDAQLMEMIDEISTESIARVRASLPRDMEGLEMELCCSILEQRDQSVPTWGYAREMVRDWMSRKGID